MDPHLRGDDDLFWGGTTSIEMTITPTPSATHRSCRWHSLWIPISIGMTADTTAIILDPSVPGTSYDSDETEKTWSVTFRYGTVSGIATCNSTAGNWGTAHGEYNNVFTQDTSGLYCWCRMLSPVRSSWIAGLVASTEQHCASICADNCGLNIRSVQEFRRAMYTTAGQ